jgi:hypothetical protein
MSNPTPLVANRPSNQDGDAAERLPVEQRRHRRIPTSLNVEVTWIDAFGFENVAAAVVKDISAGGFGIESSESRPLGSRLTVATQASSMQCVVRHVSATEDGFRLGLEILPSVDEIARKKESLDSLRAALSRDLG